MTLRTLGLMAIVVGLSSCDQVLMRPPRVKALIGRYELTMRSSTWLRTHKGYKTVPKSFIELRADSTIVIQALPDCANNGSGESGGRFLSGRGTWTLVKDFIGYGVDCDLEAGGTLPKGVYVGSWLKLRRRAPPYEIEVTVGDPDSDESIRYALQRS